MSQLTGRINYMIFMCAYRTYKELSRELMVPGANQNCRTLNIAIDNLGRRMATLACGTFSMYNEKECVSLFPKKIIIIGPLILIVR